MTSGEIRFEDKALVILAGLVKEMPDVVNSDIVDEEADFELDARYAMLVNGKPIGWVIFDEGDIRRG
jgi:hypothetical protein